MVPCDSHTDTSWLCFTKFGKDFFLSVNIVCVMNRNNCHLAYITSYAMLIRVTRCPIFLTLEFLPCSLYSVKCEIIQCSHGLLQSLIKSYFIFVKSKARIKSYFCPLSLTWSYFDANILGY